MRVVIDFNDPSTWLPETLIVRCGSNQGVRELADLTGLTPEVFDKILSLPEPNPVPKGERWTPT